MNDDESRAITRMLDAKRIAIVGASDNRLRASNRIAEYLLGQGKQIVPVNPNHAQVLGLLCYPSLKDVPDAIEVVNVFRRAEFCEGVAREAIEIGAKGIWLQSGITCNDAEKLARDAGILFVQDRCIMVEHARRAST